TEPVDRSPHPRPTSTEMSLRPAIGREHAAPGDYRVRLGDGTDVELTATTRTAVGRFAFPEGRRGSVLVNASGTAMGADRATVRVDPQAREISGSVTTGRFCYQRNAYTLHFVARFDRPFAAHGTWRRQALSPGSTASDDSQPGGALVKKPIPGTPSEGNNGGLAAQTGGYATFDAAEVEVRVGVSFVSVDGARANLEAESAGRSVEEVRRAARDAWRDALGVARVAGGPPERRRIFYTALYHALLHPSTFSDADGTYMGMDAQPHRAAGFVKYADFSGWDTYRTQAPLLAMLFPRRAADMATSLLADARESGWLPKWPVANGHTNVMVGDPAAPILAATHAFGATGFDARAALDAMVRNATVPGRSANGDYVPRPGLAEYQQLGYVPYERNGDATAATVDHDLAWGSSATTLEYAIADHAVARLAGALGDEERCRTFAERAAAWRHVLDPRTRTMAPRSASGEFKPGHDPTSEDGFVEGNGVQYTWLVPHDPAGLFEALGGRGEAARRLEDLHREINAGPEAPHAFLGNEPTLGTPWLEHWLGRPDRAQLLVREALLTLYADAPEGFPGNDDLGALSAWWVLGALGLYPAVPGTDVLVIGSPLFPEARLGRVRLETRGDGPVVRALRVDGTAHHASWLTWRDVASGARLRFTLGERPSGWGTAPPPSFGPAASCAPPAARKRLRDTRTRFARRARRRGR
ncbi:MAG TPA: GH92 family glycosyl hydrolase, partial [Solirubrobacteraceae bacterium]|nr:GH92 family glycosyl hydrolase [Solirubrobacteraceae bacterium]